MGEIPPPPPLWVFFFGVVTPNKKFFFLFLADMEATAERREFDKVMRKLNDLGNTLKLAFEFGGVDANSLNRIKDIAKELNGIEKPDEYLDSFINDWLDLPEFRPILEKWIKRACALYKYHQEEKFVNFSAERLGKDYVEITNTYESWRATIIFLLAENHLRKGEMITLDGTIYLKEQQQELDNEELNDYQKECFRKLIDGGYMCKNGDGYKWNKSKALLAYTMEKLFCKDAKSSFPEAKLNSMFGVTRLAQAKNQLYNSSNPPRGAYDVDKLL